MKTKDEAKRKKNYWEVFLIECNKVRKELRKNAQILSEVSFSSEVPFLRKSCESLCVREKERERDDESDTVQEEGRD